MKDSVMQKRIALTFLELVVVVALIAVLVALLIPAVQRARQAAIRTESANNLKQIILATHHFASTSVGRLPPVEGSNPYKTDSVFCVILPLIDGGQAYLSFWSENPLAGTPTVSTFVSPADPTFDGQFTGRTSYAANAQAFTGSSLPGSFADGTSNTIGFAEHYSTKCGTLWTKTSTSWTQKSFLWSDHHGKGEGSSVTRRATFADGGSLNFPNWGDVHPVTQGAPPFTTGSVPGLTFQAAPLIADCDPSLAQTPHREGMLAAMMDGSVRILGARMSPSTYWSAVTPSAGDRMGAEW